MQSFYSIETISHNKLCYIPGVKYCSSFCNSIFSVDKNNRDQTREIAIIMRLNFIHSVKYILIIN